MLNNTRENELEAKEDISVDLSAKDGYILLEFLRARE